MTLDDLRVYVVSQAMAACEERARIAWRKRWSQAPYAYEFGYLHALKALPPSDERTQLAKEGAEFEVFSEIASDGKGRFAPLVLFYEECLNPPKNPAEAYKRIVGL